MRVFSGCANSPVPVAQISPDKSGLYRRASSLRAVANRGRSTVLSLCRLEIGDTADWKSALLWWRLCRARSFVVPTALSRMMTAPQTPEAIPVARGWRSKRVPRDLRVVSEPKGPLRLRALVGSVLIRGCERCGRIFARPSARRFRSGRAISTPLTRGLSCWTAILTAFKTLLGCSRAF